LPEDVDWMVLIKIDSDGNVYRVCGTTRYLIYANWLFEPPSEVNTIIYYIFLK